MNKSRNIQKNINENVSIKNDFTLSKKENILIIFIFSLIGAIYQFITLSIMLSNDYLTQNDIRLWNGFFPWWTVFFTFTFWSNMFVFLTYLLYLFFNKRNWLQNNNTIIFISCSYITLVLIIVAFILLPASLTAHLNVNFLERTSALTLSALIMPHGPGPILFIAFSIVVFCLNKKGNQKIIDFGFVKILFFSFIFFLAYMIMVITLNWIKIGSYYIYDGTKVYEEGFSVYSKFTAINPNLPIVSDGKITSHGSPFNLVYYLLVIIVMFTAITIYYFSIKKLYKNKKIKK